MISGFFFFFSKIIFRVLNTLNTLNCTLPESTKILIFWSVQKSQDDTVLVNLITILSYTISFYTLYPAHIEILFEQ